MADVLGRAVLEIAGDSTTYFGESAKVKADAAAIGLAFAELPKALAPLPAALTGSADAAAKLAASFNGDRIVKQASDIVLAMAQVDGGVKTLGANAKQPLAVLEQAMALISKRGYEIPPPMQQTAAALREVAAASSAVKPPAFAAFADQIRGALPTAQSLTGQITSMATGFITGTLALQGFESAGRAAFDFLKDSVAAFQESEDAQRKLTTAMTAQGTASTANVQKLTELAEAYQRTTVNSDEMLKETEALLIQVGNVMPASMDKALAATTDLAAGLGIDLKSATMLVAKAFEDNFAALKKAGVQIDETRANAEGMEYVLGQIEQRFGGQARSEAQSYAGQIKQLGNEFNDLQEKLGGGILKTGLLQVAMALARVEVAKQSAELDGLMRIVAAGLPLMQAFGMGSGFVGQQMGDAAPKSAQFGKDIDLTSAKILNFAQQLAAAKLHLANLTAEQRENLTAAVTLGTENKVLEKQFGLTAGEIDVFKKALEDARASQKTAAEDAEKYQANLTGYLEIFDRMTALVSGAGMTTGQWAQALLSAGASLSDVKSVTGLSTGVLEGFNKTLSETTAAQKEAVTHAKELNDVLQKFADERLKQAAAAAADLAKAVVTNFDVMRKAAENLDKDELQLRITSIDAQIAAEKRRGASVQDILALELQKENLAYQDRILKIQQQADAQARALTKGVAGYDDAMAKIKADVDIQMQGAAIAHGNAVAQMVAGAQKVGLSWGSVLSGLRADSEAFSQIVGGSLGAAAKDFGQLNEAIGSVLKSMDKLTTGGNLFTAGPDGKSGVWTAAALAASVSGILAIGGALIAMAQQIAADTNAANALDLVLKTITQTSKDLGDVSEQTANQIQANKKLIQDWAIANGDVKFLGDLIGGVNKEFMTAAGEALTLSEIIKDIGGISQKNLPMVESRMGTLFDLIKMGGAVGQKAIGELNDVLKQMGDYFEANGGIWDAAFESMIAHAKELGLNLQNVNDLIAGQQDKLTKGLAGVTAASGGQATAMLALEQAVVDAQKAYDDLVSSGADQSEIAKAALDLAKAQDAVTHAAVTTQDEFDRLSRESLNAFNTMVASGKSPVEAMQAIGGSIDDLINDAKAFGLSGNAAFDELSRWRDLTKNNAPLLTQIGSLNDLMTATANLGGLNAQSFADFQAQGVSAYNGLIAAGFTQQEAEEAEKPLLESIIKLHNDKGLAIDENTQKLIDQATQDGVLSDQQETDQQVLKDGLGAIIKLLGGDIPDAWQKATDASKTAADKIKGTGKDGLAGVADSVSGDDGLSGDLLDNQADWKTWQEYAEARTKDLATAINNMPTTHTVTIDWAVGALPDLPPGTPTPTRANLPVIPMAEGWAGRVLGPTMFLAGEAGAEDVAFSGAGKSFTGASDDKTVTIVSNLYVDGKKMTQHVQRRNWRDLRKRGY